MLTTIDVKFIFNCLFIGKFRSKRVLQDCKHSSNSRCRPSSCLLAVLSMFLANSSPISSSRNEEILYSPPKQLNLVLKCSLLTVQFSSNYAAQLTSFLTYRKILPNLLRRRQLVMMNYAWDFRQSETEKYFEWMIMYVIYPRQVLALFRNILESFRFCDEDVYEYVIFSILCIALA